MGYTQEHITVQVSAQTSNHNSSKDERDEALWNAAKAEIAFALDQLDLERRYKAINLVVVS